jgi:hypothetical protein
MKKLIALTVIAIAALLLQTIQPVQAADVQLSWVANPSTDQVQNYFVYQAIGSAGDFTKVATVGTNLAATVPNLTPGIYRFEIKAANAWGVESDPSTILTTPPAKPSPVQQVQAWLVIGNSSGVLTRFNLSTGQ